MMNSSTAAAAVTLAIMTMGKDRAIRPASFAVSATSGVLTVKLVCDAPIFILLRKMWKRISSKNLRRGGEEEGGGDVCVGGEGGRHLDAAGPFALASLARSPVLGLGRPQHVGRADHIENLLGQDVLVVSVRVEEEKHEPPEHGSVALVERVGGADARKIPEASAEGKCEGGEYKRACTREASATEEVAFGQPSIDEL